MHGQADDRGLFDVATHRGLLDAFGGPGGCRTARRGRRFIAPGTRRATALAALKARAAEAEKNADFVRAAVTELSDFDPKTGEEENLAGERALMMNAARIAEELNAASEALVGERGAETCAGLGAEEIVAPAGRGAQARRAAPKRRWNRLSP